LETTGHAQASADYLGDLLKRHALVGNAAVSRRRGSLLKRQSEETVSIEPVHRRPDCA
jgi:hypothetical protein